MRHLWPIADQLAAAAQQSPTTPTYQPEFRGGALLLQATRVPEAILAGSAETGKTMAALWLLDQLMRTTPNAQGAMVRKTRVSMDGTVLNTYRRILALSGSGAVAFGGEKPHWYDYPNGARLWVGGMDNPQKILSGERDFVYVNQAEELDEDDWQTLATRVTGRGAVTDTPMLFGDCNPGPGDHWILRRRDSGRLLLLESRHEDNPTLHNGLDWTAQGLRTLATLDSLTGARKQRLRYGRWVGAEGQYFEQWDEALHVCAPFHVPNDWPIWCSLDYGFVHPLAFGVFAMGTDGIIYQIGEHVQHKWLIPQHAVAMRQLLDRLVIIPERVRVTVAGHDVFAQRGDSSGKTIAEQFAELGWPLSAASLGRITNAQRLLDRLGNPIAGMPPTLRLFSTCVQTIATIPRMVHDPRRPEDVLKINADADGLGGDDPYDMLAYGIAEADMFASGFGAQTAKALSSGKRL